MYLLMLMYRSAIASVYIKENTYLLTYLYPMKNTRNEIEL